MLIPLRNGQTTGNVRLDRIRHVDPRSLDYPIRDLLTAEQHYTPRSYTWALNTWLDQGEEGACVGFGFAHELAARPGVVSHVTATYARESLYWEAQRTDPWAGGSYPGADPFYEGTSVICGAQVVKALGLIREYRWALDIHELAISIGYFGPAVIGVDWYQGMFETDQEGFIHPTGEIEGGHCICVIGVRIHQQSDGTVDNLRSYFTLHNSWGQRWGLDGRCRLTFAEALVLWPSGEFCIPIGRRTATVD